jgi:hypothetical protein
VKIQAAELTGIGKDQRASPLAQDEVIVTTGTKVGSFYVQMPGHTQVNT